MIWLIKWWHMKRWNDLTTCHILPIVKFFNPKHHLGIGQKDQPKVGKKNHLVILDLLKSFCPRKPKLFFDPYHFGVFFGLKIQFEKPGILVVKEGNLIFFFNLGWFGFLHVTYVLRVYLRAYLCYEIHKGNLRDYTKPTKGVK